MPSRFRVRGIFRGIVSAIARPLARLGIHPDTLTYFSLLFSLLAMLSIVIIESQLLFGLFVFLTGLFDGVDGAVARLNQSSTKSGSLTDSVIDKVAEMVILFSIGLKYSTIEIFGLSVQLWVLLCFFGWLMTSYTRARAEALGVNDLDIGLGGRSERLVTLVIFSIIGYLLWGLVVVTILGLCTAAYRLYHYKQQLLTNIPST